MRSDQLNRREFVAAALSLPAALAGWAHEPATATTNVGVARRHASPHVVVIGAGAFGGWTALHLLRSGARVTLLDAWGPGNPRASSGGDTRVIRGFYGGDRVYVDWVARSFELWAEIQAAWGRTLYTQTGALWMFHGDDQYARASLPLLRSAGLAAEELSISAASRKYAHIDFQGIRSCFWEERAGYLFARDACEAVRWSVVQGGGKYVQGDVRPGAISGGKLESVLLSDGTTISADWYVFACGPWLGRIFPDVVGDLVQPTRQEVFFFGTPAADARFFDANTPVWVDFGERVYYGIPARDQRGFKVADDTRGTVVDPTSLDRRPSEQGAARARRLVARRFPALARAPIVETQVCQYENSPDGHYIIDRHPGARNVWIVGGGSGHGFKVGPALGEHVAKLVLDRGEPLPLFSLRRFESPSRVARRRTQTSRP